jgi:hypothetical protein
MKVKNYMKKREPLRQKKNKYLKLKEEYILSKKHQIQKCQL